MAVELAASGIGTLNPRVSSALNRDLRKTDRRVGHLLAPHAVVPAETFDYLTAESQEDLAVDQLWGASAEMNTIAFSEGSYTTAKVLGRALKVKLSPREVAEWNKKLALWEGAGMQGAPYVPKQVRKLTRQILGYEEYLIATQFTTAGNYGSNNKASNVDFGGSSIATAFQTAVDAIASNGRMPTVFILGESAYRDLSQNSTIQSFFQTPSGGKLVVTPERLTDYFSQLAGVQIRIAVAHERRPLNGTMSLLWTTDTAVLAASDFNESPQNFQLDDETFAATAVVDRTSEEGVSVDGSEYFGVHIGDPEGAEKFQEYGISKLYKPLGLNYALGYLWSNTDQS